MYGVSIRAGALDDVVSWVKKIGSKITVCIVFDDITRQIAGERVVDLLKKDNHKVLECRVPNGAGGRPHADEPRLKIVESALRDCELAIAVGSGTINDLTKLASYNQSIPYLSVATAPSMNGYTSAIAAIMLRGVKRTVACHQPMAVIADLDILSNCPIELIASGLGDLESKPTATADYRLGHMVRKEHYCPAPESVVLSAEAKVAESAEGLSAKDPEAIRVLVEALLLSGISMKLAGSSSPASGGEHLISHYWDMTAAADGRVEGLHGAQVGVATLVTASLYECLSGISPEQIDVDYLVANYPSLSDVEKRISKNHSALADEVYREYAQKHLAMDNYRTELVWIKNNWKEIWKSLSSCLRSPAKIREVLVKGSAPVSMSQLALSAGHLVDAYRLAREIRGRYVVLDFAANLGMLEKLSEQVFAASGVI
jgi:glycerol-1-phosphate dehydrogenase [NAD(P)+]